MKLFVDQCRLKWYTVDMNKLNKIKRWDRESPAITKADSIVNQLILIALTALVVILI